MSVVLDVIVRRVAGDPASVPAGAEEAGEEGVGARSRRRASVIPLLCAKLKEKEKEQRKNNKQKRKIKKRTK